MSSGLVALSAVVSCFLNPVYAQSPMLAYNCAKMPAICRNVNTRNPLKSVIGEPNALGDLDPGSTPGGLPYITLHLVGNCHSKALFELLFADSIVMDMRA